MIAIHTPLTGKFLHREVCDVGFLWISMFLHLVSLLSDSSRLFIKRKRNSVLPFTIIFASTYSTIIFKLKKEKGVWRHGLLRINWVPMPSNYASSFGLSTIGETTPTAPYLEKVKQRIAAVGSNLMVKWSWLVEKISLLLAENQLYHWFIPKYLLVK